MRRRQIHSSFSMSPPRFVLRAAPGVEDTRPPLLVSFSSSPQEDGKGDTPTLGVWRVGGGPTATRKKPRLLVRAETDKVVYEGRNFGEESGGRDLVRYALGVRETGSREIVLHDVPHLFPMQQRVKNPTPVARDDPAAPAGQTPTSGREARSLLVETFGSKKSREALRSSRAGAVTEDRVSNVAAIEGLLRKRTAEIGVVGDERAMERSHEERRIPPFDMSAQTPGDVYPIDGLITKDELHAMKGLIEEFEVISQTENVQDALLQEGYPVYVANKAASLSKEERDLKARCLIYLTLLVRFLSLSDSHLRKSARVLAEEIHAPAVTVERFYREFTDTFVTASERKERKRPAALKDKLYSYVLALVLHIEGFSLNPRVVCELLKLTPQRILLYFREMGCRCERKGKDEFNVALKVPLTFPKEKPSSKKTKR